MGEMSEVCTEYQYFLTNVYTTYQGVTSMTDFDLL